MKKLKSIILLLCCFCLLTGFVSVPKKTETIKEIGLNKEENITMTYDGENVTYSINNHDIQTQHSKIKSKIVKIIVYVGTIFVGNLTAIVQDEIIVSITGKSTEYWVRLAVSRLLNTQYKKSLTLDKSSVCSIYPPYGAGVKPSYCH